ncbi:MAG: OmpA family protein [Calditrichaeota bacterium]|nr:OmpA family protein [Calditrichota bacterium]
MRSENVKQFIVYGLIGAMLLGCSSWSNAGKGAAIGTTTGGVVGGVIGKQAGNTALGAILGAAIGGAAGAYIGRQMDKQAEEIREDIDGARIERVGEGIKITFDSGIMFDVNKSDLKGEAETNLAKLATILNKYPDTEILLEGHTDNTGAEDYNMALSERRAQHVADYLRAQSVGSGRLIIKGYGEVQPVADNESAEGRQLNRRVEVAIYANDKLKNEAQKQAG